MTFSTSIYSKQLSVITKKPRDYGDCHNDVVSILCPLSYAEISILDDLLVRDGDRSIRKIRIPNTVKGYGKSSGYRVIVLCNAATQNAYLLYVYAKKGSLATDDLTSKGAKILIDQFDAAQLAGEQFVPICVTPPENVVEELIEAIPAEQLEQLAE